MAGTWKERERALNAPFVDELRGAISRSRLTPTEVAFRAGFAQSQVSEWLNGKTSITLGRFVALAHAAGLNSDEIAEIIDRADRRLRASDGAHDLAARRAAKDAEAAADAVQLADERGTADNIAALDDDGEPDER